MNKSILVLGIVQILIFTTPLKSVFGIVGLILLHPASSSTYDKNFYDSMLAAKEKLGFDIR